MNTKRLHIAWKTSTHQTYFASLDGEYCPISNIDSLKPIAVKENTFPGGEQHLRLDIAEDSITDDAHLVLAARYNTAADLIKIVLAADAARRLGFSKTTLILPYFPAARQDRVCNVGEPLTVKIFADMINSCGFDAVHILSPHSEVTPALLNNVVVHDECELVETMLKEWITASMSTTINIVCPDAGAGKRVGKVASYLAKRFPQNTVNLIRCEKVRDVRDGSLKEFFVQADDLGGHPTLIIDDIVAYGGTFLGLADKLRERNCGKLGIFVSHADCDTGLINLRTKFDAVGTTDSKRDYAGYGLDNDPIVKIIPFKVQTA